MAEWGELNLQERFAEMRALFERMYTRAEAIVNGDAVDDLRSLMGDDAHEVFSDLAQVKHAARGVVLTLAAYKACAPEQDIRAHKAEQPGGFAGRSFDSSVTIPFLIAHSLPRSVESHWLTQTFSFAGPFERGLALKTTPKQAGPLLVEAANLVEEGGEEFAEAAATLIIQRLIEIRNQGLVVLTRPKDLSIESVAALITRHLSRRYRSNAPRLPQLVIYAVYKCLVNHISRYHGMVLEPLERMKSADRKAGTVGDIVVTHGGMPVEAVEIKYAQEIEFIHLCEAIEKVRAKSVRRYYILSTKDVSIADAERIDGLRIDFLKKNGCEIILNGVIHSLSYYLRLLPDTTEFLFNYTDLLENDEDATYEHRIAWNECCDDI